MTAEKPNLKTLVVLNFGSGTVCRYFLGVGFGSLLGVSLLGVSQQGFFSILPLALHLYVPSFCFTHIVAHIRRSDRMDIWAMSTTETALTAHLVIPDANVDDAFLAHVCNELHEKFEIQHSTIQIERGDGTCKQESEGVV